MRAYRKILIHRRVIVNLHSGKALSGVLVNEVGPLLVLRDATLLEASRQPVPIDGEAVVDKAQVDFVQAV